MSLAKRKIDLLREFVYYNCMECDKHEDEVGTLEPHRINQEMGYILTNIKMICGGCHEIFSSAQRMAIGNQQ